ncbi:MAG: hypothetical protein WCS07_07805 [Sphaerochaeta sp.]
MNATLTSTHTTTPTHLLASLEVNQQDLEAAMEGHYTTTITVEIISGI